MYGMTLDNSYADTYINEETDVWTASGDGEICRINYAGKYYIEVSSNNDRISAYVPLKLGDELQTKTFEGGAGAKTALYFSNSGKAFEAVGGGDAYLILFNGKPLIGAGGR